ncbi:MAG TPA: hypothetical protein DCZ01_10630 [Elusimicrobia bacterium]|nr:MAG: hypothetical protein A2X37_11760 [Elusimicrobia bacterium GWA2_66_18]OGR69532.1 MAG: hypothetical protein A2X40_00455 [Elusimicrobia bacterium GWC2_65_9]HAZ08952.1 hypothetical protein [Elusimicrobiota bacterium]
MAVEINVKPYVEAIISEIGIVSHTLKTKGIKRFQRACVVSGLMIFVSYAGVFAPHQKKSARLNSEIQKAKTLSEFGAQYKTMSEQLSETYARLPTLDDRDQWLSNSVRDSLNVAGLVTDDFRPVNEQEQKGLLYQTSNVTLNIRFFELYDWLLRLESARPMMHILSVSLSKKGSIGYNRATCEISTVIPKQRYR